MRQQGDPKGARDSGSPKAGAARAARLTLEHNANVRLGSVERCVQSNVIMTQRFVVRPDPQGFSVIDIWTGEPAVLAMAPQTGLAEVDAKHTSDLFNRFARNGDRTVRV